ncbi:F-box protein [Quillaja saponaria]|uniref:F-box protein n=1 Tax=Quillaja saponaria TaxID=32244 RepID=A0AAD7VKJ2_QUISA|nr:F-box protein [Quillaja saponaria]
MAVLKPTKRSSIFQREKNRIAPINSLPNELLQQVLARVAATSFSDIYNAKLSCKAFLGAAEDDFIFEHISMDKFPRNSWDPSNKVFSFLKRCLQSGNAEALYRKGMMDYFSDLQIESGRECLKRAAQKGHMEAKYVYAEPSPTCLDWVAVDGMPTSLVNLSREAQYKGWLDSLLCSVVRPPLSLAVKSLRTIKKVLPLFFVSAEWNSFNSLIWFKCAWCEGVRGS